MWRLIAFAVMAVVACGYYAVVERPAAQESATFEVMGLEQPVDVIRDRWGVPHVYAQSEADLFFAQGYVTAQDRLWQMDLTRRAGSGRLSEIFGEVALNADKAIRALGFNRMAQSNVAVLSERGRALAQAYADGVNAFIEGHRDRLPVEFSILGYAPEPWTVEDMFSVAATIAQTLQNYFYDQIWRARAQAALTEVQYRELNVDFDTDGVFLIDAQGKGVVASASAAARPTTLAAAQPQTLNGLEMFAAHYSEAVGFVPGEYGELGSNNWAVDGTLTDTGKPYLANDPHLPTRMPPVWYEVHLSAPDWDVSGVSLPGILGVSIGHNERIAWGITNANLAVQDLFVEQFNPDNPAQYRFQDQWREAQVIEESIIVKGLKDPIIHRVLVTHHGPVVTELFEGQTEAVALGWSFLAQDNTLEGILHLNQAKDWPSFRQALSVWNFDFNFVYADVDGNIGYQLTGQLPQRPQGFAGVPVPGWTGEYDWQGVIPFEQMPHALNAEAHFVATANQRPVSADYQPSIPGEWATPYRSQRIVELLQSKPRFTLEDMRAIQADSYASPYRELGKLLAERVQPATSLEGQVLRVLKAWDGVVTESSVAPVVVEKTAEKLVWSMFQSKLGSGAEMVSFYRGLYLLLEFAAENPYSPWFDDLATKQIEALDDLLSKSLHEALAELAKAYGPALEGWTYGKVLPQKFTHAFTRIAGLNVLFDRTTPTAGGRVTVNRNTTSYRQIVDLSNFDRSRSGLTSGQAGHPFAEHYGDQLQAWRTVQPHPMLWERESITDNSEGVLRLVPK